MKTNETTAGQAATLVTFRRTCRYAGGRSHRNITTLEYIDDRMDIIQAADHYRDYMYPAAGDDFTNGILDANGNEVMAADDYKEYMNTGIGRLDFVETAYYSCLLNDVDVSEFCALPDALKCEYMQMDADFFEFAQCKMTDLEIYQMTPNEQDWLVEQYENYLREKNESN